MSTASQPHPERDVRWLLADAGLRPTRQRLALGRLLFGGPDRHITAEALHAEVRRSGVRLSLATVYNALEQFKRAGLLREIAIEGSKSLYDTNTSDHHHLYIEGEGRLVDLPSSIRVTGIPSPPEGFEVGHVDVIVRIVRA